MSSGISADIDNATATWHQALTEDLSIVAAVRDNSCAVPRYVGLLRMLTAVFGVIERRLDRREFAAVQHAGVGGLRKLPWLHRDLVVFRHHLIADHPVLVGKVLHFANTIRQRTAENPRTILAYLYALEGATQFVRHLGLAIAADSPLAAGCSYCAVWGAHAESVWRETAARLDRLPLVAADRADLLAVAVESYQFVAALLATLDTLQAQVERVHALTLNPHSPDHPVAQSPRHWRAVNVTTDRFLATNNYYRQRLGVGAALRLDGEHSFLITAVAGGIGAVANEAKLLAAREAPRGIPPSFVAQRLELLAEELVHSCPDEAQTWSVLRQVASWLMVPADNDGAARLDRHLYAIQNTTGFGATDAEAEALRTIVEALYAEQRGFGTVAESVIAWYTEPQHFAQPWIRTLQIAVSAARRVVNAEDPAVTEPLSAPPTADSPGPTILVVDDNDTYRAVVRRWLMREGYAVREAADGAEALRVVDRYRPAVVITDIFMPEQDGLEMVRQLRGRPYLQGIIIMTGHGVTVGRDPKQLAAEFGVSVVFHKPIEKADLLAAVRQLLARKLEAETDSTHGANEDGPGRAVFDELPPRSEVPPVVGEATLSES